MSTNDLAKDCIQKLDEEDKKNLAALVYGEKTRAFAATHIIYPEIGKNAAYAYGLLVQTGYLKASNAVKEGDSYRCTVEIPSRELFTVFSEEILDRIIKDSSKLYAKELKGSILDGDAAELQKYLSDFLEELIPFKYNLEVSSPGLERKLKSDKEYLIFKGRDVKLKLRESIDDTGEKLFTGKISDFDEKKGLTVFSYKDKENILVKKENIVSARLYIKEI